MSEYWKSTPKHFCKYCNVWMQDNKPSIRLHEGGSRHKEAVETFFKNKRDAKQEGAMGDRELNKELREIEKAARAQAAQDAAMFGGSAAAASLAPPPPPARTLQTPDGRKPPPPPPRRDDGGGGYRRNADEDEQSEIARLKAQAEAEAQTAVELEGRYTVDGITYLEGKRFDAKLTTGTACQLWVEAADEWAEARILRVQVTAVPNTDIILRKFSVAYRLSTQAAEEEEQQEDDVNPDRLRMIEAQIKKLPPPPPAIEQSTGLGGWQTVAVREVDEEAERRAGDEAIREEAKRRKEEEALKRLKMMEDALEGEDAMSSYDPHGRGMYKGIDLKASATAELNAAVEVDLGGDKDGPVAFKKKRPAAGGGGGGAAKFRRKRTADEDD